MKLNENIQIKCLVDNASASLILVHVNTSIKKCKFSEETYTDFEYSYGPEKLIFDKKTLQFEATSFDLNDYFSPEAWFYFKTNEKSHFEIREFLEIVSRELNEYVYRTITDSTFFLKETKRTAAVKDIIYDLGCLRHIYDLELIEKVAKISGLKSVADGFKNSEFVLNPAKKLRATVSLPIDVLKWIKQTNIPECLGLMQRLCKDDDTVAEKLMGYLKAVKKIYNCSPRLITVYLGLVLKIKDDFNFQVMKIVEYLASQNFYYPCSDSKLPTSEAQELIDTLKMMKQCGLSPELPSNLVKTHRFLSANSQILLKPRKEEFANAVAKYSALACQSDNFVVKIPESEQELFNEGQALHHCVASYRDSIIDDGAIVLFVRKKDCPDEPFITIEVDKDLNLFQVKENFDTDVLDKNVFKFLKTWQDSKKYFCYC